jgi:hypothetical protein
MCFYTQQHASIKEVKQNVLIQLMIRWILVSEMINGFVHLKTPVIVDETPDIISTNQLGLIPSWAKDKDLENTSTQELKLLRNLH